MERWAQAPVEALPGPLYVSLDLDGLDPAFAPGVAHPEPGGLSTRDVVGLLHRIRAPIAGGDVVELSPRRDIRDLTARVAAKLLKELAAVAIRNAAELGPAALHRPAAILAPRAWHGPAGRLGRTRGDARWRALSRCRRGLRGLGHPGALAPAAAQTTASPDPRPELTTLLGRPVFARPDDSGAIAKADAALAAAPGDIDRLLAAARARDAALQFHAAIELYTRGLAVAPADVRLLRFRGHRYISIRKFDLAAADLEKALALAPTSFDVAYHLGLAHYLRGDFEAAARVYRSCLDATAPGPLPPELAQLHRHPPHRQRPGRDDRLALPGVAPRRPGRRRHRRCWRQSPPA